MGHILIFIHQKEFINPDGKMITMKALITMHGVQSMECYENDQRYQVEGLQEVMN